MTSHNNLLDIVSWEYAQVLKAANPMLHLTMFTAGMIAEATFLVCLV